jgi:NodT family efflux transporter outer membrane factor (OMF) lipoprotein
MLVCDIQKDGFMRVVMLGACVALSACSVGPDYAPPKAATPAAAFTGDANPQAPSAAWWQDLGDAQLSALIAQGLRDAPQIAVAQARLRQARAGLASSRAAQRPAIGVTAAYLHADLPGTPLSNFNEFYNLGFDAQWEVDLWGGKKRGVEQARALAQGALAEQADAQVALAAEIARNYVTLRAREVSFALVAERHLIEVKHADFAQQRFAAGTLNRQAVEAARATAENSEAEMAALEADQSALHDALAVLTGRVPGVADWGALDNTAGIIPLPPAEVKVGDPAAMLVRRPDIRAADRAYAAATAGVGVAKARQFPTLSLMGIVGLGGTGIADAVDPSTFVSLIAPTLRWNGLNFGRTRAGMEAAAAGQDLALARYQGAVLAALQDAQSALARFGAARKGWGSASLASAHAGQIRELQMLRADAGTIARSDALESGRALLNARLAQTNARAALTLSYVSLSKALGLGWQADAVKGAP